MHRNSHFGAILLISGVCLASGARLHAATNAGIARQRAVYEKNLADIDLEFDQEVAELRDRYAQALDRAEDVLREQGDPSAVLAVREEKTRFEADKSVPSVSPVGLPAVLTKAQDGYRTALRKTEVGRGEAVLKLARMYMRFLDAQVRKLTAADELKQALVVQAELERVKSDRSVTAAQFVLADAASMSGPPVSPEPHTSTATPSRSERDAPASKTYRAASAAVSRADRDAALLIARCQWSKALEELTEALMEDPAYQPARAHQAECYAHLGLFEQAADAWREVQKVDGDGRLAWEAEGALVELKGKTNILLPVPREDDDLWHLNWKMIKGKEASWHEEEMAGQEGVLRTHPISVDKPLILRGVLHADAGDRGLRLQMRVKAQADCVLEVYIGGNRVDRKVIDNRKWLDLSYSLSKYLTDEPLDIEIHHAAGGANPWHFEHLMIDYINVTGRR